MKRRIHSFMTAALVSLSMAFSALAQTNIMTLDDAMQMTMKNSPSLDIAEARLAQSAARSTQAGAAY